jgi:diguanylate cyclase (GGDEF)-like protein
MTETFLRKLNRLTLREQMEMLVALLCIGMVAGVSITAATIARSQATDRVQAEMVTLASNMAQKLDARMFERLRDVRNLASMEPLRNIWGISDNVQARGVLEELQRSLPEYTWIGFASADGVVISSTGALLEGVSVAARPWFQNALKGITAEDVHDAKLLAGLLQPQANNEPFRFVDVAVPVSDGSGGIIGVIGGHMSWTWAAAVRETVLATVEDASRTEIWVLGRDGKVLLGPEFGASPFGYDILERIERERQISFQQDADGGHMVAAVKAEGYMDYPGLGWTVVARRPLDIALASARGLAVNILLVGLLVALVGMLAARLIIHRVTKPLCQLTENVDQIGRDPTATMVEPRQASKDVLQLSFAIRSLLRRLDAANASQEEASSRAEKARVLLEENEALQVLADTDPLTGLLNKRAFRTIARDAMNVFRRHRRDIGVLIIDIDHFKKVNDSHGHLAGDAVLSAVGTLLLAEARNVDKIARFGGEEFLVLMRDTERQGPAVLAERIRERVAAASFQTPTGEDLRITVSVGSALARAKDRDIDDVIERADRALYQAKRGGRNRVMLDSEYEAEDAASAA